MIGEKFQPKGAYRAMKLIFYALNSGLLLFFIVAIYLNEMQIPAFTDGIDILTYVNVFLLASIPAGYTISSRRMEAIDVSDSFAKKFEQFQAAMIIRWAMIEGTALFSLVGLIVLQDAKQLILFIICILALSSNTVTKDKVTRMAKLNSEESKALGD
jgi:F0F1-type ATP synthase membrane subunit c/vacuolar-type H+-ATPase subunit K